MNPWSLSLSALRAALDRREYSPLELLEHGLRSHQDGWGAYRVLDVERARDQARDAEKGGGPLCGIPVSVKDLFGLRGTRCFAGSPMPLPARFEREGPLVRGLRSQGAVFTGKTHTVEFAFGGIGTNMHWCTPTNPRAPDRVPGGSSSGAAVSLLDGSAWLALGTDTAGSVRIPASFTGVVGLKVTKGCWSTEGIVPLSPTLDTPGILTRTVEDSAFAFSALEGRPPMAPADPTDLRLRVLERDLVRPAAPEVGAVFERAMTALSRARITIQSARIPEVKAALRLFLKGTVTGTECHAFLSSHLGPWKARLQPHVAQRIEAGGRVPGSEYLRRRARLERLQRSVIQHFDAGWLWAAPTTLIAAPRLKDVQTPEDYGSRNLKTLQNTSFANQLGLCALSLPCGQTPEGLPVGLMLMGPPSAEGRLLAVGQTIERQLGSLPPLS
ncbi:MAG: amidase [Myxococcota bacterium]